MGEPGCALPRAGACGAVTIIIRSIRQRYMPRNFHNSQGTFTFRTFRSFEPHRPARRFASLSWEPGLRLFPSPQAALGHLRTKGSTHPAAAEAPGRCRSPLVRGAATQKPGPRARALKCPPILVPQTGKKSKQRAKKSRPPPPKASPAEPRSYLERPDGIERRRCILAGTDRKL
jgi:hypothetical protein